ncbi:MAG: 4Fe-4S dicluster domain-containing protein [Candidatus Aegiribacteria sp.]|nr:4Fe-4S dicluster domain-containing protein [Candidatus Aegiribacteria sp.]
MVRLDKKKFDDFIRELSEEYSVYAPGKAGGKTEFIQINPGDEIELTRPVTDMSPKSIFFPPAEVLFEYDEDGVRTPQTSHRPIAVFGMRSCDARSLVMLDRVFGSAIQMPEDANFQDPYWKEKYDTSLIFGFACNEPLSTCFCNWLEGGPHNKDGMDVFVVNAGDFYLMEPVSDKGIDIINRLSCLTDAAEEDEVLAAKLASDAKSMMAAPLDSGGLGEKLTALYDEPIWGEISAKCVNCGACTFSCPTCHCFDVQDEGKGKKGKRVRIWDSCMFPIFTMEASGHNPRALSSERVRQRVMHKYSYYPENYGEILCTGCGRCVMVCPVNLDIREVLKRIISYNESGKSNE